MDLLDEQPIIDRLKARAPCLRDVGAAADLEAVAGGVIAGPQGFVVPVGATPYEVTEGSGPLRQTLLVTMGVIIALTLAGKRGAPGMRATRAPSREIRSALFGWTHPDAWRAFHHAGEGIEDWDAKAGLLLYRLDFSTLVRVQEDAQ